MHFQMKIISDELWDTMFFCTGKRPTSSKTKESRTLSFDSGFKVLIKSFRSISVNGDMCKSIPEAKFVIMKELLV
jgi:hypothetical protein